MEERGVAVIMAMWLLAVLAIFGTTFAFMMRLEPMIARHHRDDMKATYVAQAGIDHALYILKQDTDKDLDYLGETWASGLTNQILYDEETPANIVGSYTVTISDESGKTNLNTAPKSQLMGLNDIDSDRADAIIAHREGAYKPFETIDELMCVTGITQTVFDNNKEIITVYTGGLTNLNTASYSVFKGIEDGATSSLDSTDVTSIIAYREGINGPYDTATAPPAGTTEKATEVNSATEIDNIETEYLTGEDASGDVTNTTKRVDVKSDGLFTIVSIGVVSDVTGKAIAQKKIRVVVDRGKQTPAIESSIKYYKEEPEE